MEAEYPYPDKRVIQPTLGEYIPPLAKDFFLPDTDAAQVAVRLSTLSTGASVLGVNWGHILGDAAAFSRFLEDVSLFYNTTYIDLSEDMPTMEPHVRLPSYTDAIGRDYQLEILKPLPMAEMAKGYSDAVSQSQPVTVTLTRDDLAHIVLARRPGEKLSDNDLITGWWVSVLERAGQQVDYIVQTINVSTTPLGSHKNYVASSSADPTVPLLPQGPSCLPPEPRHTCCQCSSDAQNSSPTSQRHNYSRRSCCDRRSHGSQGDGPPSK